MNLSCRNSFYPLLLLAGLVLASSSDAGAARISPQEAFQRTKAVFADFGLAMEPDISEQAESLEPQGSRESVLALLPYFDPWNGFDRFSRVKPDSLEVFQDRDARLEPDFSIKLNSTSSGSILEVSPKRGLHGLRIAIDPGHMGGDLWDRRTDKYVTDKNGRKISEGLLTLQTALLLEKELTDLGAQVLLTRRELSPVTNQIYESFDLNPYAEATFRESSLLEWFQQLLGTAPAGTDLFNAFRKSSNLREIYSEAQRPLYFILKADLDARAQLINDFAPDLTLILHFDTAGNPRQVSKGHNGTKAYVPGAFLPEELGTRENRFALVRHLAQPEMWKSSVGLSSEILKQIRSQMQIPIDSSGGGGSIREAAPGVFARNLVLTRKIHGTALAYLECLFYNDPLEFKAFSQNQYFMTIGARSYGYSERLVQLSKAIRDGVLSFSSQSNNHRE